MAMKIGVVNVVSLSILDRWGYLALQEQNLRKVMGNDVQLVFESGNNNVEETSIDVLLNPFYTALDGKFLLEKLYKLQNDGCDGVMVSCTLDPIINEARALLKIPFVGAVEASVYSACMAGSKFGFLVHRDRRCKEMTEDAVVRYGLQGRMTPSIYGSERYDELVLDAFKNPQLVKDEILDGCRQVVEAGAHSVILGSTSLSNLATACGISTVPGFDAPVFDPVCVGAKMLEYRIGLQRDLGIAPTSRAGWYKEISKEFQSKVMETLDFAA